jgi:hypothetical protein
MSTDPSNFTSQGGYTGSKFIPIGMKSVWSRILESSNTTKILNTLYPVLEAGIDLT